MDAECEGHAITLHLGRTGLGRAQCRHQAIVACCARAPAWTGTQAFAESREAAVLIRKRVAPPGPTPPTLLELLQSSGRGQAKGGLLKRSSACSRSMTAPGIRNKTKPRCLAARASAGGRSSGSDKVEAGHQ